MIFVVMHQCNSEGCSDHYKGEWRLKREFTNPWKAYLYLREQRIFNYKSKYKMGVITKRSSPCRTFEFTVPLKQVGTGWGYGKTRWYRKDPVIEAFFNGRKS